jgi:phosphoglycolate phosphatase-like HAD superfamily hydrolase
MVAMDRSAHLVTGREGLYRCVEFAGRTDRQIARDLIRAGGNDSPEERDVVRLIDGYVEALERGVGVRPYRALGGVREAVGAFRDAGAVVGLGTGNVVKGARIKLTSAGLVDLFDLTMGGYGDDGETRAELLLVGARRCDPEGRMPVVVIGDTPHDVRGGRAIDALCVAVATGPCAKEDLRASNPDLLVDALDEGIVERVEQLLGDGP